MFKKDLWAREQLSKMALYEITVIDVAKELGCNKTYVSQIFSNQSADFGKRGGISREKVVYAISNLIDRKVKEGG